jgi:solute carrier family 25 (mitochondrial citrate transporter), member 1
LLTTTYVVGVISGLAYTVKTTGFLSLYNGLGVTLVGSIPKAGIRFGGNAYCKKLLADENGKLNMGQQFLAGMGAGTIEAILAVTPMETIKTKLIEVTFSFQELCTTRCTFTKAWNTNNLPKTQLSYFTRRRTRA